MALPEIPALDDFLAGARVVAEELASGPHELVQRSPGSVLRPGSEVWLAYPSGALQLNSVLKKVGEGPDQHARVPTTAPPRDLWSPGHPARQPGPCHRYSLKSRSTT